MNRSAIGGGRRAQTIANYVCICDFAEALPRTGVHCYSVIQVTDMGREPEGVETRQYIDAKLITAGMTSKPTPQTVGVRDSRCVSPCVLVCKTNPHTSSLSLSLSLSTHTHTHNHTHTHKHTRELRMQFS